MCRHSIASKAGVERYNFTLYARTHAYSAIATSFLLNMYIAHQLEPANTVLARPHKLNLLFIASNLHEVMRIWPNLDNSNQGTADILLAARYPPHPNVDTSETSPIKHYTCNKDTIHSLKLGGSSDSFIPPCHVIKGFPKLIPRYS
jgi:hypothetical protein